MQSVLKVFSSFWFRQSAPTDKKGAHFSAAAKFLLFLTAILAVFLTFFHEAEANSQTWKAQETVRSHHSINLKPGAAITFEIHFKNTGTSTWSRYGANFVALATVEPEKRPSAFEHAFWEASYRPAFLKEGSVAPGEIGTFRFSLLAPEKEGEYEETFQAVAKDLAWIDGTKFTIPIKVVSELPKREQAETQQVHQKFTIQEDYPVRDASYAAEWIGGQKVQITAQPGQQILQNLEVKNIGSTAWSNSGSRFVSAYTVRPNYHDSPFFSNGPGWMNATQIRLVNKAVAPGQTGQISLLLQAPDKPGNYTDRIRLAAENYSWMKGGEMEIEIIVIEPAKSEDDKPADNPDPSDEDATDLYRDLGYEAKFLTTSHRDLSLKPGETITFQVGFKNTGTKIWKKDGQRFVSMYTISPNYRASRFATRVAAVNDGWLSASQVEMVQDEVGPGQLAFFRFDLTAPKTGGSYTEDFRLAVEDHTWIKGGEFSLPVNVNGKTGTLPDYGNIQEPSELGPMMRVGLFSSDDPFSITADSPFEIRTGSGAVLVSLPAKTEVVIDYDKGTNLYHVQAVGFFETTTAEYIITQALDNNTIMEILSFERRLPWNPVVNENLFRGSVEIRHSEKTGDTWAINVLPMEHYLRGIAETSSESPVEFLKVMSIAARTYAHYHYERQTKHADKYFYVDSNFDQVYRGYALEKRHPRLVEAVTQTTGEVVTYTDPQTNETKIAITPYFSRSDGRTRDWSEVWGGEVPWAKSVPVPHDQGKTLYGHGVGMSARGGLLMVVEDGATYDEVLHYFFQGIAIEDRY